MYEVTRIYTVNITQVLHVKDPRHLMSPDEAKQVFERRHKEDFIEQEGYDDLTVDKVQYFILEEKSECDKAIEFVDKEIYRESLLSAANDCPHFEKCAERVEELKRVRALLYTLKEAQDG